MADKIVVWDAGHGGTDSGAVGGGLKEKDLVLSMALQADEYLTENYEGVKTYFTRSTDVFIELEKRATIASNKGADAFVSFHINSATGGLGGFETFLYNGQVTTEAKNLQSLLHEKIYSAIAKYRAVPDRGKKTDNLSVLRNCTKYGIPACLTETLFISVANDVALLKQAQFITDVAHAHAVAVAEFLGLEEKQTKAYVFVNNVMVNEGYIIDGRVYSPIRAICEALDIAVGYNATTKKPTINGVAVDDAINKNGTTYAPVRTVCEMIGATFNWYNDSKKLKIWKY